MISARKIVFSIAVAAVLLLPFAKKEQRPPHDRKVIVIGMDGLDPELLSEYMKAGELPAFRQLAESGSFKKLGTSNPPQSPVAWASFITGSNPGKHNVFDFLTRDPKTYMPKLTITEIESPAGFELFGRNISMGSPVVVGYRKGTPFWETAHKNGVPVTALLIPVTFPPDDSAKILSGMGVPDVVGTNGTFSYYTTDPLAITSAEGGRIFKVSLKGKRAESVIKGPRNDLLENSPETSIPFTAEITGSGEAEIHIQNHSFRIFQSKISEWKHIEFSLGSFSSVKAIVKFLLISTEPEFRLYVTPVNMDPADPVLPISNPPEYSAELERAIGPYSTQGMPEDTWALTENVISDGMFLAQTDYIQKEREEMFFLELSRLRGGILSAVFVSSDRVQHMFWRYRDTGHPLHSEKDIGKNGNPILKVYKHMDEILSRTMKYLDSSTTLIVISDHGFKNFRRAVNINSWLVKNGYMLLKGNVKSGRPLFRDVDWSRTQAYAMGLNGIYINMAGRESEGIVSPSAKATLMAEISEKLLELKDGAGGAGVIRRMFRADKIYSGDYLANSPDMIIGYREGYRASWQTALGAAPDFLIEDNLKKWSGDHMIDPELVPGVILSNKKIISEDNSIMDVAPTILSLFGLKDDNMDGKIIQIK